MSTVESNGASIYYEVHGDGPAVVFAHGRGGNAASWWRQVPHFARRFKAIPYDQRTFGRSAGGGDRFTQRQMADDLIAILDAEGIERAALVTQSMGGWSGLGAALWHPQRVICLVLTSTIGGLFPQAARPQLEELLQGRIAGASSPLKALAPDYPAREPELALLFGQIHGLNINFDARNMLALLDAANGIPEEDLQGYATPTLVISAENDQIFPPPTLKAVAEAIPGAELESFPGAGHSPYWEDPERYNDIVERYLDRHLPG